jgi:hypothetical protein
VRATLYNPPLPRMKPQPPEVSGMIVKRITKRRRRLEQVGMWETMREDMRAEAMGEWEILKGAGMWCGEGGSLHPEWGEYILVEARMDRKAHG